jgi:hypothetical protein
MQAKAICAVSTNLRKYNALYLSQFISRVQYRDNYFPISNLKSIGPHLSSTSPIAMVTIILALSSLHLFSDWLLAMYF